MTVYIYNQNTVNAGKVCNEKDVPLCDVTLYTDEDIDYLKEILDRPIKSSNDLFKYKVAVSVLNYFEVELYKCEVCGRMYTHINIVRVAEFDEAYFCDNCLTDECKLVYRRGE